MKKNICIIKVNIVTSRDRAPKDKSLPQVLKISFRKIENNA